MPVRGLHQPKARIADQRRTGIADHGDGEVVQQFLYQSVNCIALVVFVHRDKWRFDAEMRQQALCMARILGCDEIRIGQDFARPGRQVVQVTDWRGNDEKCADIQSARSV